MTDPRNDNSLVPLIADRLIHGDRQAQYGTYGEEAERIRERWQQTLRKVTGTPMLELPIEAVPHLMIDLKLVRLQSDLTHADSWVDVAGYAGCAGKLPQVQAGVAEIGATVLGWSDRPNSITLGVTEPSPRQTGVGRPRCAKTDCPRLVQIDPVDGWLYDYCQVHIHDDPPDEAPPFERGGPVQRPVDLAADGDGEYLIPPDQLDS